MSEHLTVLDLFSGYSIREDGRITSRFGRIIKSQISNSGYLRVELAGRKYFLHRLLAQAFLANPEAMPVVNHIDGNKTNNLLSNLEWTTRSENQSHAYRTGLQVGFKKSAPLSADHKAALRGSRWRHERRTYELNGKAFSTLHAAAAHFGVSRQTVLNRVRSANWSEWSVRVERI
ncbi:HNH endonuclease signature motif containing protein [Roseomonas mucosa]|uniref:HNH endonuclease signature motif containing protein n=1 Tax=Roseomonas mucosa TaxID=207340 RepID=UPI00384B53A4